MKLKKKTRRLDIVFQIRRVSRETRSCICVYTNAVANGVMLQFHWGRDFCNIVSKIKQIVFSPRVAPPQTKNYGCAPGTRIHGVTSQKTTVDIF